MPTNKSAHKVHRGDKFGRLIAIRFSHYDKHWRRHYLVRCECGKTKTVQGTLLRSGNTKSCGCLASEVKKSKRLPKDAGVINHLVLQYKRHAKGRNIAWQLRREEFEKLVRGACIYCGEQHGNIKITKNCKEGFAYNGVDRLDSDKPYHASNCVSCCGICNRAKGVMTYEQFKTWIKKCASKI